MTSVMDWLNKFENATEFYNDAKQRWPLSPTNEPPGKWILGSYDDESIIVYQAFDEDIARYACEHGRFVGCPTYSETRMTCKIRTLKVILCSHLTGDVRFHRD
jgi:hypothetical protein